MFDIHKTTKVLVTRKLYSITYIKLTCYYIVNYIKKLWLWGAHVIKNPMKLNIDKTCLIFLLANELSLPDTLSLLLEDKLEKLNSKLLFMHPKLIDERTTMRIRITSFFIFGFWSALIWSWLHVTLCCKFSWVKKKVWTVFGSGI